MKRIMKGTIAAALLATTVGCHAHIRTTPVVYSYTVEQPKPVIVVRVQRSPPRTVVVRPRPRPHHTHVAPRHHTVRSNRGHNHRRHYHNHHGKRVVCHRRH